MPDPNAGLSPAEVDSPKKVRDPSRFQADLVHQCRCRRCNQRSALRRRVVRSRNTTSTIRASSDRPRGTALENESARRCLNRECGRWWSLAQRVSSLGHSEYFRGRAIRWNRPPPWTLLRSSGQSSSRKRIRCVRWNAFRAQISTPSSNWSASGSPRASLLVTHLGRDAPEPSSATYPLDYIDGLFTDWTELHGDRAGHDDHALIGELLIREHTRHGYWASEGTKHQGKYP